MSPKNHLPYFRHKASARERSRAKFLAGKLNPFLKRNIPQHYLVNRRDGLAVDYLKKHSRKNSYFLRLDVDKFFPSIDHSILIHNLPLTIKKTTGRPVSRQTRQFLKNELPKFLEKSPLNGQGIPLGNYLGYILTGAYLLPLDLKLYRKYPFLRFSDDYIILCQREDEPRRILENIVFPELDRLNLTASSRKIYSGRFHRNPVTYMGYTYYYGRFGISAEKKEAFKRRIDQITYLIDRKPIEATIKKINNQIHGFGNYYKHCSVAKDFDELDHYVRGRVRRYIIRQRSISPQLANAFISNNKLYELNLRSLRTKLEKYRNRKTRQKNPEFGKSGVITGKSEKYLEQLEAVSSSQNIGIKNLAKRIDRLTRLEEENKKKLEKIEAQLAKLNNKKK